MKIIKIDDLDCIPCDCCNKKVFIIPQKSYCIRCPICGELCSEDDGYYSNDDSEDENESYDDYLKRYLRDNRKPHEYNDIIFCNKCGICFEKSRIYHKINVRLPDKYTLKSDYYYYAMESYYNRLNNNNKLGCYYPKFNNLVYARIITSFKLNNKNYDGYTIFFNDLGEFLDTLRDSNNKFYFNHPLYNLPNYRFIWNKFYLECKIKKIIPDNDDYCFNNIYSPDIKLKIGEDNYNKLYNFIIESFTFKKCEK